MTYRHEYTRPDIHDTAFRGYPDNYGTHQAGNRGLLIAFAIIVAMFAGLILLSNVGDNMLVGTDHPVPAPNTTPSID